MHLAIGIALAIAIVFFVGKRIQKNIAADAEATQKVIDKIRRQRKGQDNG